MGRYTRVFLWVVLAAFALAALVGIGAVVGVLDDSWKLIGSLLSVALFGLTALGTAVVYERNVWRPVMLASFALSALGLLFYLVMILAEPGFITGLWKGYGLFATWAIAAPHLGHMELARLEGMFRVIKRLTQSLGLFLAAFITLITLWEPDYAISSAFHLYKILSISIILTLLGTVATPVLHWIYGTKLAADPETTRPELEVKCPRCDKQQTIPSGQSACSDCGLQFDLKVEEPRCPTCNYLLFKLQSPQCPECGSPVPIPKAFALP